MESNTAIIIFGLVRWDSPYSSTTYSLAKELSKKHAVYYIDSPFTVKDYISNHKANEIQLRKKGFFSKKHRYSQPLADYPNLTCITPPLILPINWLPSGVFYNLFLSINNWLVNSVAKEIVQHFHLKEFVFLNVFNPFYLKKINFKPQPLLNIYYTVDDISESLYVAKHGVTQEKKAFQAADLVLATSKELEKKSSLYAKTVHYLPNAADISIFHQATNNVLSIPDELKNETRKIIIYIGNIRDRDDFPLLQKIATTHHDKLLLIIGPINTNEHKAYDLHEMDNVRFLGGKPMHELPNYMKQSSVAIIPFKLSKLTKSIYPLKINEYLAAGLPVVSTKFSEDIISFQDVIYIAESHEDFLDKISLAIENNSEVEKQKRINTALNNTWEARAREFLEVVTKQIKKQ